MQGGTRTWRTAWLAALVVASACGSPGAPPKTFTVAASYEGAPLGPAIRDDSHAGTRPIDGASNAKPLDALVGDFVLAELRAAHTDYGRVLGITAAKANETSPPALTEPLRAVTQAITAYALQVVAAGQADPELAPVVRKALRPIDDVRTVQARRAAAGEPPSVPDDAVVPPPSKVNPTTPVPDV